MSQILIVEDDFHLNEALCQLLWQNGYAVRRACSLAEGLSQIGPEISLIIADLTLPDGSGFELCKKAHQSLQIPVIVLTAKDAEEDMLQAFDCGADDYLVKPFPMKVLLKHMEAIFRRSCPDHAHLYCHHGLVIDLVRKQVCRDGTPIALTAREYQLLELFACNAGTVVTKKMMLEQVWDLDGDFVEENTVHVTLNRLKKKIEPDPAHPIYIKNVFGLGYTMEK